MLLLLWEKFRSFQEKFLLIQMKLPSEHAADGSARGVSDVEGVSLPSGHAAVRSSHAGVSSISFGVPSIHATGGRARVVAILADLSTSASGDTAGSSESKVGERARDDRDRELELGPGGVV